MLYGSLSLPPGQVHRLASELMRVLAERKSPLLLNDLPRDKHVAWLAEYAKQLIAVPLQRQEQVLGRFNTAEAVGEFLVTLHDRMPHTSGQVFRLDSRVG